MSYTVYEKIRYELFEKLLPAVLCTGTKKERKEALKVLMEQGENFVRDGFVKFCEQDRVEYPYRKQDFQVNRFERGGIYYVQFMLPKEKVTPGNNDILRAYILYSVKKETGEIAAYKYFIIKHFADKDDTVVIHIDSEEMGAIGHTLTGHEGDMEYEYHKLAKDYVTVLLQGDKNEF